MTKIVRYIPIIGDTRSIWDIGLLVFRIIRNIYNIRIMQDFQIVREFRIIENIWNKESTRNARYIQVIADYLDYPKWHDYPIYPDYIKKTSDLACSVMPQPPVQPYAPEYSVNEHTWIRGRVGRRSGMQGM
jgi:hypothetical protein